MRTSRLSLIALFIVYGVVLFSWTIYRYTTHLPEYIDELLAKPLIWLIPVILVMFWKRIKLKSLGFATPSLKIIFISAITGVAISLLQIVPNFFKQPTQIMNFPSQSLFLLIFTYSGTAISEEVLFRGFILQQLKLRFSVFTSVALSSLLFALIHLPILLFINNLSGTDLVIGLYILFSTGALFGILFLHHKTIWSPIIAHYTFDVLLSIF